MPGSGEVLFQLLWTVPGTQTNGSRWHVHSWPVQTPSPWPTQAFSSGPCQTIPLAFLDSSLEGPSLDCCHIIVLLPHPEPSVSHILSLGMKGWFLATSLFLGSKKRYIFFVGCSLMENLLLCEDVLICPLTVKSQMFWAADTEWEFCERTNDLIWTDFRSKHQSMISIEKRVTGSLLSALLKSHRPGQPLSLTFQRFVHFLLTYPRGTHTQFHRDSFPCESKTQRALQSLKNQNEADKTATDENKVLVLGRQKPSDKDFTGWSLKYTPTLLWPHTPLSLLNCANSL